MSDIIVYKKSQANNEFVELETTLEQLTEIFEWPSRNVYTTIINLTNKQEISGEVVGTGSISVNGSSALRRTISGLTLQTDEGALAQDYNWVMTDEIRVYQGISNELTNNEPIYFNLGTFCLSSFSAAESVQGTKISISGKDRMVLLNGERGGTFTTDVELHIRNKSDGTTELVPIKEIIEYMLEFAGIKKDQIHINIEDETGRELLEYRGKDPLYIFSELNDENKIEVYGYTPYGDSQAYSSDDETKDVSNFSWGQHQTGEDASGRPTYSSYVSKISGPGTTSYDTTKNTLTRVTAGQVAGYNIVPLTYPGELKAAAGETVVSVLDKIVNTFGKEYEYFFDVDGEFYFQKKKALLSMTRSSGQNYVFTHSDKDDTNPIYTSNEKQLLTSLNRQPKIENIKNDFTIWGTRPSSGKDGVPIHSRYVIDEPFQYYTNDLSESIEETETDNGKKYWKWKGGEEKSLCYDQRDQTIICEQLYQMSKYRGENGEYILIPEGKEHYARLFPDIQYYWRQIYNPEDEGNKYSTDPTITEGTMKPTHWFGNKIPEGYEADYKNIYIKPEGSDTYCSWADSIDLSTFSDVFEDGEGKKSLYDKTGYANRSMLYLHGTEQVRITFFDYIRGAVSASGEDELGWTAAERADFLNSLYYRAQDKTGYTKLYEQLPLVYAKPHCENEKWTNLLTILCYLYETESGKELRIVRSVGMQMADGSIKKYTFGKETTPSGGENEKDLSTILQGKIVSYQPYTDQEEDEDFIELDSNTQLYLLQPKKAVMEFLSASSSGDYTFNYANYHNYSFHIHSIGENNEDIWAPWIEEAQPTDKNTWRFVTGYNIDPDENGNHLQIIAPLNTVSYSKDLLYKKVGDTAYALLIPGGELPTGAIYLHPTSSVSEKIPLTNVSDLSFQVSPCDWAGNVKTEGAISQTKYHPAFAQLWEYNADTHMKLAYEADPALLPFELVWIVPQDGDELKNCTITRIGDRTFVKTDKAVTALKYDTAPPLYFSTDSTKGFVMSASDEKLFVLSRQGVSAEDYFKNLLFEHAYCNETASTNIIPLYYLEPNNYIDIIDEDITYHFILSQFSIPLSYNGQMSLTLTRDKLARLS